MKYTIHLSNPREREPLILTLNTEHERDVVYWNLIHLRDEGVIDTSMSITRHSEPEGVDIVLDIR